MDPKRSLQASNMAPHNQYLAHNNYLTFQNRALRDKIDEYANIIAARNCRLQEYEKIMAQHGIPVMSIPEAPFRNATTQPAVNQADHMWQPHEMPASGAMHSSSSLPSNPNLPTQQPQALPPGNYPPGTYPPGIAPRNPFIGMPGYAPFDSPAYSPLRSPGDYHATPRASSHAGVASNYQQNPSGGDGVARTRDSAPAVNIGPPISIPQSVSRESSPESTAQCSSNDSRAHIGRGGAMDLMPINPVNNETMSHTAPVQRWGQGQGAGVPNFERGSPIQGNFGNHFELVTSYPQGMEVATAGPSSANQIGGIPHSVIPAAPDQGSTASQNDAAQPGALTEHYNNTAEGLAAPENHVQAKPVTKPARKSGPVIVTTPDTQVDPSLIDPRLWELWRQGMPSSVENNVTDQSSNALGPKAAATTTVETAPAVNTGSTTPNASTVNTATPAPNTSTVKAAPASNTAPAVKAARTSKTAQTSKTARAVKAARAVNTASTGNTGSTVNTGPTAPNASTVNTASNAPNASTVKAAPPFNTATTGQGVQLPVTRFLQYTNSYAFGSQMAKKPRFKKNGSPHRPWIFGYTFPGTTEYSLYYLTCPKMGCPAFKSHPLVDGRGAQHIRACGGEFQDEAEMIRKFGTQLTTPNGDRASATLNWARKWNNDLMIANGDVHLVLENFPV